MIADSATLSSELAQLSDQERAVLGLIYGRRLSYADAARELELPRAAIAQTLATVRARLVDLPVASA